MRILIDISHPAHVHFFRLAIKLWAERGHEIHLVSRQKDITTQLLRAYGLCNSPLSISSKGKLNLLQELFVHDFRLIRETLRVRPDLMLQIGGLFVSHAGFLCGVPNITFTDTEMAHFSNALTFPFTTAIITPTCYSGRVPAGKHHTYNGYHELAYLHPKRFTPDVSVLGLLGLSPDDPFFIVRFVSWGAAHDVGESGFSRNMKLQLVQALSQHGRVLITSEGRLPKEIARYQFPIGPELIHHVLAFASLYIGESATMASEAAVLGIPSIFVSTSPRGYTTEQEEVYDMTYTFSHLEQEKALAKMRHLLSIPNLKEVWQQKRQRLLNDKIDVTEWLVRLVEGYPLSLQTMCSPRSIAS